LKAEHIKYFYSIALLIVLMFAASIPWRMPHVDDAWLGEHSFWLATDGVVKSKLMSGIAESEDRLLLYHKLHIWIGAAVIKAAGFKLHLLKATSLVFLLFVILLGFRLGKMTQLAVELHQRVLLLVLLLANPLVFEFGFVFRPEILLATLALLSFMFLYKSVNQKSNIHLRAGVSGVFAGLATLAHLNGLVFVASGFLSLLLHRRFASAGYFALAALVISLAYFIDFRSFDDFSLWYQQLTFIPVGNAETGWWQRFLLNLRDEHMRYFHSPKEIVFSLLIVFTLFISGRNLWKTQRLLLVYTLMAMIMLGFLGLHKTSKYIIPLLPFWSLMIVAALSAPLPNKATSRWGMALGVLSLGVSLFYNATIVVNKYDPILNQRIREAFAGSKSKSLKVAAPMEFIFDEIDDFEAIQGLMAWSELRKLNPLLKGEGLLRKALEQDIDLILLSRHDQRTFGMQGFEAGRVIESYVLIHKTPQLMIWSRLPATHKMTLNLLTQYDEGLIKFNSAIR
jgi:hypothetical protein